MHLDELIKTFGKEASASQVVARLSSLIYKLRCVVGVISQEGGTKDKITLGDIRERIDVEMAKEVTPVQTTGPFKPR